MIFITKASKLATESIDFPAVVTACARCQPGSIECPFGFDFIGHVHAACVCLVKDSQAVLLPFLASFRGTEEAVSPLTPRLFDFQHFQVLKTLNALALSD